MKKEKIYKIGREIIQRNKMERERERQTEQLIGKGKERTREIRKKKKWRNKWRKGQLSSETRKERKIA